MSAADGSPGAAPVMQEWALYWASLGFRVIPLHAVRRDAAGTPIGCSCRRPRCDGDPDGRGWGKHPIYDEWQKDAANTDEWVNEQWGRNPHAQIGIATGAGSGLWVLDLDGPEGIANLAKLEQQHGPLPATMLVLTGSGGQHMYWRYPADGRRMGQRAGVGWHGSHIDVRGEGGQVVAAPCANRNGTYRIEGDCPIADAPEWLLTLCAPREDAAKAPYDPEAARAWSAPGENADAQAKRLWAYLASGAAALAATPAGRRNDELNRLAYRAGGLHAAAPGLLSADDAQAMILDAARRAGLGTHEAVDTMTSGWRGGAAKPWTLPDRDAPRGRGRPKVARDNLGHAVNESPIPPEPPPHEDGDAPPPPPSNPPGDAEGRHTPHPDNGEAWRASGGPGNASRPPPPPRDTGNTPPPPHWDTRNPPPPSDSAPPPEAGSGGGEGDWEPLRLTDLGNARRLKNKHGANFRAMLNGKNTGDKMSWLIWEGDGRWKYDDQRRIWRMAAEVPRMVRQEAERIEGDDDEAEEMREAYEKWANKSESSNAQRGLLTLAQGLPGVTINPSMLDGDPMLLNCRNGTLDLKSGILRPHKREDYQTKMIRASYDENADCPAWIKFLTRIMGGDLEMVNYLQMAIGYSLTGLTSCQCMFVMYGTGSNGKSTFIDTIKYVLADYAGLAAPQTFAEKRDGQVPNDIAKLAGLRIVLASEPKAGAVLEESLVKQATGDAELTARFLNQEFFDFTPQFKLWMATNHKPTIKGSNEGIWRRIRLIPFEETIGDDEKNPNLPAELRDEADGIMRWALEGLARWLDNGRVLTSPAKVRAATDEYRVEMDRLADFFTDCCDLTDKEATTLNTDLYRVYVAWSREREEDPMSQRAFFQVVQERKFRQHPSHDHGRRWVGIRLKRQPPPSATDRKWGGGWGGQ